MITKKPLKIRLVNAIFGCLFGILGLILPIFASSNAAYAVPDNIDTAVKETTVEETTTEEEEPKVETKTCDDSLGSLGWLVCPTTGKISEAVDWLYAKNKDLLEVNPVVASEESPIYQIWKYCLGVANIAFIIFLLVAVYSQITGVGISNYGIKKVLPKLIVAAIMVNLSFLICSLAVDASNIIGNGARGIFTAVEESTVPDMLSVEHYSDVETSVAMTKLYTSLSEGTTLAVGAGTVAFEGGEIWMLIPAALAALVAVVAGLITIALRQVVVTLLIMIAPLAIVAYILPNTESLFRKWKDLLVKMLVFYPMYSLLFGASSLAGWAIIASSSDGFGMILGTIVKILPLFFSWSLMKMSGTFLGTVNAKITGLFAAPLATNRAWAESHKAQTSAYFLQYGRTPYSSLRRYLDDRKELREQTTAKLTQLRKNKANIYAQRKFTNGYDGSKSEGNSEYLTPNKYTRIAKDLATSNLLSETATMDTAHVLDNYESYYTSEGIRDRVRAAEQAVYSDDKEENKRLKAEAVARIKASDAEFRRANAAGQAYLEYSRAQMTAENDSEADFNFMVGRYLDASMNYDPNEPEAVKKYRHYIVSSAGGLGEVGQTRVLGKIIAKAAAVETNQRRDIHIVAEKFPPDKRSFRNFLFNYFIDDDGYATDRDGNILPEEKEHGRDWLRVNDPDKLVMWDKVDENGPYFDWYDTNGKYVTRIYKKDKSAIKELMSNFDAPINDPINNMFAIHAGIKENKDSEHEVLRNMGLDAFRTTVGRALLGAPFKEKNAMFSPMVAEMVKKGYIKNYAHLYLAYLDSFNKATKPGAFNQMDADAVQMFGDMMDPDKWDEMFPTELIRDRLNVNGEEIYGVKLDEDGNMLRDNDGNLIKVPAESATREELMARIKDKFIVPAAVKAVTMMSKQTQSTMDNQKPGTIEKWKAVKETFDNKWGGLSKPMPEDPYRQPGDMREITMDIKEKLYTIDKDGNKHYFADRYSRRNRNEERAAEETRANHAAKIYEIFNSTVDDGYTFAGAVSEYLRRDAKLDSLADMLDDFVITAGYGVSKERVNEFIESEILPYAGTD